MVNLEEMMMVVFYFGLYGSDKGNWDVLEGLEVAREEE